MRNVFRPDIESLRGLSVLAVVGYHAFPAIIPGGFIGVDIFFVISGFLITRLLLIEHASTGAINLGQFWARRIRRILPAATLVLIATAALFTFLPATDSGDFGRQIMAAAAFYFNQRQAQRAVDYLANEHLANPLLHYWSLAVEEQFYLVWPLLLAGVLGSSGARGPGRALALVTILGAVSLLISTLLTTVSAPYAFFSVVSRAWQLLAGAFVAVLSLRAAPAPGVLTQMASLSGLAIVVASFFLVSGALAYPGLTAALPTLAMSLLVHAGRRPEALGSRALVALPLGFLGRISYSWYLWHWPLLLYARTEIADDAVTRLAAVTLALGLAALTRRVVEEPIRRSAWLQASLPATYALGVTLIVAGVGTGLAVRFLGGSQIPVGDGITVQAIAVQRDRPVIYQDHCVVRFSELRSPPCVYGDATAGRTVVLLGDSRAGNWFPALEAAARASGWRLIVRIKASCRPIDTTQTVREGHQVRNYTECTAWLKDVLDEITARPPDLIIATSTPHELPVDGEHRVIERLTAAAPTVLIRSTPRLPEVPIACLRATGDPERCRWPITGLLDDRAYPQLAASLLPARAEIVDLRERMCPAGTCRAVVDRTVTLFDSHHMTASFAVRYVPEFTTILERYARQR